MHKNPLVFVMLACLSALYSPYALAQQSESGKNPSGADDTASNSTGQSIPRARDIDRQPVQDRDTVGMIRRSIIIVDDAHLEVSERFGSFMSQVDGFFSNAGSNDDAVSNGSWARIRVDGIRSNGEDFELDTSVKLRAVLPRTERKLKLLVSTEDDDRQEAGDVQSAARSSNNDNASLALRFIRSARDNGDVNIDVGVRRRDGDVQYFGRLATRYSLDIGRNWIGKAANSYYHYSKSGYRNTLSFDFRRRLFRKDNLYFRTYTDFNWEKNQKGSIVGHSTGFYWQFGDRRSLALEGLANYHTALNPGIADRFRGHEFRIRWRHNVWRPWFFYEIWPSVAWPSTIGYRRAEGFLIRAEVVIGQKS